MSPEQLGRPQIERLLPHGPEVIFLDQVTELKVGERAVGWINDPAALMRYLQIGIDRGFSRPIFIETLAQLMIVAKGLPESKLPMLLGLRAWKFSMHQPNGPIRLEAVVGPMKMGIGTGNVRATCGRKLLAKGQIQYGIIDKPNDSCINI